MTPDEHRPTCNLRFVEREIRTPIGSGYEEVTVRRILRQLWESVYVGVDPEWRDVPLSAEDV